MTYLKRKDLIQTEAFRMADGFRHNYIANTLKKSNLSKSDLSLFYPTFNIGFVDGATWLLDKIEIAREALDAIKNSKDIEKVREIATNALDKL